MQNVKIQVSTISLEFSFKGGAIEEKIKTAKITQLNFIKKVDFIKSKACRFSKETEISKDLMKTKLI